LQLEIKKKDLLAIVTASCGVFLLSIGEWEEPLGSFTGPLGLSGAVFLILFTQVEIYRRLARQQEEQTEHLQDARAQDYRQLAAFLWLISAIKPRRPLPPMRGWAISPDLGNILISAILDGSPKVIVECGCGVSTLLMSYCMKQSGHGHIFSLEHDAEYAELIRKELQLHQLADMATVICAPLRQISLGGQTWSWYDIEQLNGIGPIDLLFIDGPPGTIQEMARYPALPVLYKSLSENATVIFDDADRHDERRIIERWLREFKDLHCQSHDTEHGAVILNREPRSCSSQ